MTADWTRPYPRDVGSATAGRKQALGAVKYWPPIGRVDNVYGDRNLFCSCVPVSEDA
jgi:glycine dehydrogenase